MSQEIEDRGSSIRVSAVTAYPLGRKAYVKVETNMGVTGWGEINHMDTPVACALAESLATMIVGENPTRTEHLWQRLFRAHRNLRNGGLMVHCISALDMALCFERETLLYYHALREALREKDLIDQIIREERSHIVWLRNLQKSFI